MPAIKKLKTVVIGADIEKIGAKAFYKCVNLKKVTIQTTKLKAKTDWYKSICKDSQKSRCESAKSQEKGIQKMAEKAWNRWKTENHGGVIGKIENSIEKRLGGKL